MKFILVILLISSSLLASENFDSEDCGVFNVDHGCIINPAKRTNKSNLIIYIRGLYKGMRTVPTDQRSASIDDLTDGTYHLRKMIQDAGISMYLTSVHTNSFDKTMINKLVDYMELADDAKLILVSHSGGYRGLYETLKNLNKSPAKIEVSKIIMLDNFYMSKDWVPTFKQTVEAGASCRGFLTKHNETRYNERFKEKVKCEVDGPSGFNHITSVDKCLIKYINDQSCR